MNFSSSQVDIEIVIRKLFEYSVFLKIRRLIEFFIY